MIWPNDVSFDEYHRIKDEWFSNPAHFIGDLPVDAQFALDLIFKTLVDDKEHYPYLTTMPEPDVRVNSIMLELILTKYSRAYRKYLRNKRRTDNDNK